MSNSKIFLRATALMATTTFGAGLFALPYLFQKSGSLTGVLYLAALSAIVAFVHELYRKTLIAAEGEHRLTGLSELYLGRAGRYLAPLVIHGGLFLALLVYLILADRFVKLLLPEAGAWGWVFFWLFGSLPLILNLKRFVSFEIFGMFAMLGIVAAIVFRAEDFSRFLKAPVFDASNLFLPFGAILFALAGWTAVEPVLDSEKGKHSTGASRGGMIAGTVLASAMYLLFVISIFGTTGNITEDTLSGLIELPLGMFVGVVFLGLIALWTSYMPVALEIQNALTKDFRMPPALSLGAVLLFPPLLYLLGFHDFIAVLGIVGGVFVALSYALIIFIAFKMLSLTKLQKALSVFVGSIFLLAALYEVFTFLAR